jgi:acyl-CoA thioester hydrolase
MQELLQEYPVVVQVPVAWGEMDAFQHVNNIVYFRYFENARIAYSEKVGLHRYREETGIGPILGSVACKFKIPLTFPDVVSIGARVIDIEADRLTMKHIVVSARHNKIAAEGDGVIVIYDYREGKKTALPEELRKRILELEKR